MKSVIRFLLICILISITSFSKAQTFRIETGYYNSGLHGADTSTTYMNAYRMGATVEFKLYKGFTLTSGAMFNIIYSNKRQGYPRAQNVNYLTYGHSIDIPARVTYYLPMNKNLRAFLYTGPTFRMGLDLTQGVVSTLDTTNIKFTGITSQMRNLYSSRLFRYNVQMGLGGGVEWKNYSLKSGYDFGLFNMNRESATRKMYEGGWYITFGYKL